VSFTLLAGSQSQLPALQQRQVQQQGPTRISHSLAALTQQATASGRLAKQRTTMHSLPSPPPPRNHAIHNARQCWLGSAAHLGSHQGLHKVHWVLRKGEQQGAAAAVLGQAGQHAGQSNIQLLCLTIGPCLFNVRRQLGAAERQGRSRHEVERMSGHMRRGTTTGPVPCPCSLTVGPQPPQPLPICCAHILTVRLQPQHPFPTMLRTHPPTRPTHPRT
jgi:hypothetical protein